MRLVTQGTFRFLYPFLPIVASEIGLTTARSGVLLSALAMGGLFAPALRRLLAGGQGRDRELIVRAGIIAGIGALVAASAPVAILAIFGFLLFGVGKPLADIGTISYVSARVSPGRLARATSTMELTWAGGLIVVAPIAGAVAELTSWRVALAGLGAISLMFTGLAAVRLKGDSTASQTRAAAAPPIGRAAALFLVVVFFMYSALEVTFAAFGVWLVDAFGTTTRELGGFAALGAVGELIGCATVLFFGDRLGTTRVLTAGLVVIVLGGCALPFSTSAMTAAGALGIVVLGTETALVAGIPLAARMAPHARTRLFARMVATSSIARFVMAGIAPAIYSAMGIIGNAAVSVAAAILALAGLRLVLRAAPALRDSPVDESTVDRSGPG